MRNFIWELFTMQYLPQSFGQRHWYWPSSDKVIGLCQKRRKPVSFPDYFLFIYLMGRGRNRFFNLCVGVGHFLHSGIEFSSWNSPEARSKMKILFPRVRNVLLQHTHWSTSITHSCPEVYLTSVAWIYHAFENNLGLNHIFAKYSKECCR